MIKYRIGEERHYTKRSVDVEFPLYFTDPQSVIEVRIKNERANREKLYRSIHGQPYEQITDLDLVRDLNRN